MRQKIIFLCMLIFITYQLPNICKKIEKDIPTITQHKQTSDISQTKACFVYLIEKGEYESIDKLEQSLNDEEEVIMVELLNEEIKRLKAIEQFVIQTKTTCEPVLKWAQNLTHIFVAAKLSHRWDSPPCLKSIQEKYELENSTLMSNAEIKFHFIEKLHKKTKQSLEVKKDGVGTYSLTFEKQQQQIWPYLFEKAEKVPLWQQIMNRNSTIKTQYENLLKRIEATTTLPPKNWNLWLGISFLFLILPILL